MLDLLKKIFRKETVRVRIAPSPTGYLHIGTARTALFNWIFARQNKGKFILRIEDTDLERSDPKYEKDIIEGLTWLGLEWDEGPGVNGKYGPYRQSERLDIYEKYLKQLLEENKAYYCSCSKDELDRERQEQMKRGEAPKYSGKCRSKNVPENEAQIIRFKAESGTISFHDIIRGEISFDAKLIGDIAIAKNTRTPLYNFAVVIDDYTMRITHVIRGEDHIANTPKQILLQQALGFPEPKYGHLPLILDPDRSKMSKRFSATSINEYKEQGYLPEALINFIALLGWHPTDDSEKMEISEIIEKFDLERIQKGGAIFDVQKLDWLNSQYIQGKSPEELFNLAGDSLTENQKRDKERILKLLKVGKSRMRKLSDIKALMDSFELNAYEKELLNWKQTPPSKTKEYLEGSEKILSEISEKNFAQRELEKGIMPFADAEGRGEVLWPLRVALSGQNKSPGPFEIMEVIGKEEALRRINIAIKKLES